PNRFNFALLKSAIESTAKLSSFVVFILIGARIFSLTFYGVNVHLWVEHLLTSLPGGQVGFLVFVNTLVFFLAFFLDFFEIAFITPGVRRFDLPVPPDLSKVKSRWRAVGACRTQGQRYERHDRPNALPRAVDVARMTDARVKSSIHPPCGAQYTLAPGPACLC